MEKNNFGISAELSIKLKSVAILLMVVHHAFGLVGGKGYSSLLVIQNTPVELIVGRFGKICVAIFIFLSGYGFFCTLNFAKYSFKQIVNKIFRFYLQYIIIFFLFIPYLLFSGEIHWHTREFFQNLFTVSSTYNGAWWFVGVYINILILYPAFIYITRDNTWRIIIFSLVLFSIGILIHFFPEIYFLKKLMFLRNTFLWQVIFFQGYLFAKHLLFRYLSFIKNMWHCIVAAIIVFFLRTILPVNFSVYENLEVVISDFVLAPVLIYALKEFLRKRNRILLRLGKHTTNIWLTHSFFLSAYFSYIGYYPKISLLIIIFTLFLSILISFIVNYIMQANMYFKNKAA